MATVPDDQIATVQTDPIPGRAIPRFDTQVSPADFGAGLGQGLQEASNDISMVDREAKAKQKQAQEKADADADRVVLAGAITNLSKTRDTMLFGSGDNDPNAAYRQTGKSIADMPERYGATFNDAAEKINATLTPHQQSMFAERVATEKDSLDLQLKRYQSEQGDREAKEMFRNAGTQAIQSASNNHRDPAATPQAREDLFNAGMALATRGGKDQVEAYKQSGYTHDLDQLHEGVVGAWLADGDVRNAQKYLNAWSNDLSSGTVKDTLQNRITAAGDRIEALNKDTSRDRIADQRAAALAGLPGWEKLAGPGDYGVVHKGDAQTQYQITQKMAAAGTAEKRFDQMPIPDVQNAVLSTRPTEAKPGVAEDLHLQQFLEEAAQRSINRRQADPMQFAISSGQGPKPIDFSDAQGTATELRSRANMAPDLSQRLGVPMSLLSKEEAKQMTTALGRMPPDQRLQSLAQLRQSLPDDSSYANLLHSIAPNSPLTALAGASLDRPNKGDAPSWYNARFTNTSPAGPVGQRTLEGEEILRDKAEKGIKTQVPMPPDKSGKDPGLDIPFRDAMGGANSDLLRGRPDLMQVKFAQFKAVYAADASKQGKLNGVLQPDIAAQAARDVLGTVASYNHSSVAVPPGMDPTRFEGAVNGASRSALQQAGYSDADIGALRGFGLRELGDDLGTGRYVIINGHGDPLKDKAKQNTVIIDLNQQYKGPNAPVPQQATHTAFAGKGGSAISTRVQNDGT